MRFWDTYEGYKALKFSFEEYGFSLGDNLVDYWKLVHRDAELANELKDEYEEYKAEQSNLKFWLVYSGTKFDMMIGNEKLEYCVASEEIARALVRRLEKAGKLAYFNLEPERWT